MRKLLLTSSALVAAASISSYAVADVSVTGAFEWTYSSTSSNIAATDGDAFGVDNELTIKFTNKTDSGLTITGVYDMDADAGTRDETWMSVAKSSPSVVVIPEDVDLYAHSNSPLTDTSATAYDDILAAATRAEVLKSNLRIKSPFIFKFYINYINFKGKIKLIISYYK
jgi:hypothetical protein